MAKTEKFKKAAQDAAETEAKIVAAVHKLVAKFQAKAQRAAERLKTAKGDDKRAIYRRRFELYGDVASDLEERVRRLRSGPEDRDT
ncbi:hypothetical protein [Methylobacterium nigriterrae]|uniref:hypothetical protein n=1 Tax=Methylobacterium nigriterrae TaxID=3127512 RepID=UPI00301344EF